MLNATIFTRRLGLGEVYGYNIRIVCMLVCFNSVLLHMLQNGDSALMMAAMEWGMTEIVSMLLSAGANIDILNKVKKALSANCCRTARCSMNSLQQYSHAQEIVGFLLLQRVCQCMCVCCVCAKGHWHYPLF